MRMKAPSSGGQGSAQSDDLAALQLRIGRAHLRHRLSLESEHEVQVFRKGTHLSHLENWIPARTLLHATLSLSGLRGRGQRNTLDIDLRRNRVALANLPPTFEGYTVLHLSDLHLDLNERHLSRLIERVQGLACDVCVLTGDYRFATRGQWEPAVEALERLRPNLPQNVYAVLGNHDSITFANTTQAQLQQAVQNGHVLLH